MFIYILILGGNGIRGQDPPVSKEAIDAVFEWIQRGFKYHVFYDRIEPYINDFRSRSLYRVWGEKARLPGNALRIQVYNSYNVNTSLMYLNH